MIFQFAKNKWIDFEAVDMFQYSAPGVFLLRISSSKEMIKIELPNQVETDQFMAAWEHYVRQTNRDRDNLTANWEQGIETTKATYQCQVCGETWRIVREAHGCPPILKCPNCGLNEGKEIEE